MIINSGTQFRHIYIDRSFSFYLNGGFDNVSGISNFGVSGSDGNINYKLFTFSSGNIFDINNKYIYSYNPEEILEISGNLGTNYFNYFINDIPICLYTPVNKNFSGDHYFYVSAQNHTFNFDLYTTTTDKPNYEIIFPQSIILGKPITGLFSQPIEANQSKIKIFTGSIIDNNFYSLNTINELINKNSNYSGNLILQYTNILPPVNYQSGANVINGISGILNLQTNFGTINQNFVIKLDTFPFYTTDFIEFFTGFTGANEFVTGTNLSFGFRYYYELQTLSNEDYVLSIRLINHGGHTGQKFLGDFEITGVTTLDDPFFIHGYDYQTGFTKLKTGFSDSVNFYGVQVTGLLNPTYVQSLYPFIATGNISYHYELPLFGGSGFGNVPTNTLIKATGSNLSLIGDNINFVYGRINHGSGIGTGILTGKYYESRVSNIGTGLINNQRLIFTGNYVINYSYPIWSGIVDINRDFKIFWGITGQTGVVLTNSNSGKLNFNNLNISYTGARSLNKLINFSSSNDFNFSGDTSASQNNFLATNVFYPNNLFWNTTSTTNTGYIDFEFLNFSAQDSGNIQYYSLEVDLNSNFSPYIFHLEGFNSYNDAPVILDSRTGENFYTSSHRIFKTSQTGLFNIVRLKITSGVKWEHLNSTIFNQGLKIKSLNFYNDNIFIQSSLEYKSKSNMISNLETDSSNLTDGRIYITKDGGLNWTATGEQKIWTSISLSNDANIIAATTSGDFIYISNNSGITWTSKADKANWIDISISANGQYQAAINQSGIYTSNNFGDSWTYISSFTGSNFTAITNTKDGGQIFVCESSKELGAPPNNRGYLYFSNDFGATFNRLADETSVIYNKGRQWVDIQVSENNTFLAVENSYGGIFTGLGINNLRQKIGIFSPNGFSPPQYWRTVSISNDAQYQIAAGVGIMVTSNDSGVTWSIISGLESKDKISWSNSSINFDGSAQAVCGDNNKIYISKDYGDSWLPFEKDRAWTSIAVPYNPALTGFIIATTKPPYFEISSSLRNENIAINNDDQKWKILNLDYNDNIKLSGNHYDTYFMYKNSYLESISNIFINFGDIGLIPEKFKILGYNNINNYLQKNTSLNLKNYINEYVEIIDTGYLIIDVNNSPSKNIVTGSFQNINPYQYIKLDFSEPPCFYSGWSNNPISPSFFNSNLNIFNKITQICGILNDNTSQYIRFSVPKDGYLNSLQLLHFNSGNNIVDIKLQSGSIYNTNTNAQFIASGFLSTSIKNKNLLFNLTKKISPFDVLPSGDYVININCLSGKNFQYSIGLGLNRVNQCDILVDNVGINNESQSLNGIYRPNSKFNSNNTLNNKTYYEHIGNNAAIWWDNNTWLLSSTGSPITIYASGLDNVDSPFLVKNWIYVNNLYYPIVVSNCYNSV
jgi:photosystem II stability/assembly factor-like uncharacterized protein